MSSNAIEVKDLCIDYRIVGSYSIKKMLFSGRTTEKKLIHAVRHASFEVEEGEILGIVGKNGSGKSTLLNAIAGIFAPNQGTIDLHGHSISLLSIGVGFNKEISGRENIMLSGLLLGFPKKYIESRIDEIIEFSELENYIDNPVRTYSSGMYSKLAFSVTAILETEIMLIDEVLSVGDEHFKKKSLEKMHSLIKDKDRTVLIVSHSIPTLQSLCSRVMWMHDGEIRQIGDTKEVLKEYAAFMK